MSELLKIIQAQREALSRSVAENIERAGCRSLAKTRAGEAAFLLDTLSACSADKSEVPCNDWLTALRGEAGSTPPPWKEVFAGLNAFEQSVRFLILEQISEKQPLASSLAELADAVDRLRQALMQQITQGSDVKRIDYFAALAESSNDFICLTGAHGEPFFLNPAAKRMLGLPEGKTAAETKLHDFYAPESWTQIRDVAVPAVNKTGIWRGRNRLRNIQTGKFMEVLTTMVRFRSSDPAGTSTLAVIHREMSDRDEMEHSLAEARARKHAILESSLDPIITVDHEGIITEFNRAAEATFGYPRDKILGTKPSDLLFPPSMDSGHKDRIERYLSAGEGSMLGKRAEVEAVRANGETFSAEMTMTISQEHGDPVMSFFVRDISARKKAESEQAHYAAELERSNQELEQFAYVASHDLQEPLRKIRTFSDRLLMKQADKLDDDGRECLERMQSAATRMQSLIDGLLSLSRVTTRGQNFVQVDLAQIAAEVVSDLEEQIQQVHGRIEVGKLPSIQADPLQMRQLIQNLLANGLKFHGEGVPPVVTISGRYMHGPESRKPGQLPTDEQCRIVVEDNGIGFEDKYADRIFGIFQRLHPRDAYEGTGIGLAICRRIAERHGGTITAHGIPDQGCTFEVLLPVARPKRKAENEVI